MQAALAKTAFLLFVTLLATTSVNVIKSYVETREDYTSIQVAQNDRNLAISDWVDDRPVNYTLLNRTCPLKEKKALQAALLMAYVGFGSEYMYMGYVSAAYYKAAFFTMTMVISLALRFYPIPAGGDSILVLLLSLVSSGLSMTSWAWQVNNFMDMYRGEFLDACARVPTPIFSFTHIYYWSQLPVEEVVRDNMSWWNFTNITRL